MVETPAGKESQKQLENRLKLFKRAYEKEKVKAQKSLIMEEILLLQERLERMGISLEPINQTLSPVKNQSQYSAQSEATITHKEKVKLANQMRVILPDVKIKVKMITLETHGQYLWAMKKMNAENDNEKQRVAWWCMRYKPKNVDSQPPNAQSTKKAKKKKSIAWSFTETDLHVQAGLKGVFVDAGTANNGQKGKQKTTIAAFDGDGKMIFEEIVGDKTNNEGEIMVIIRVLKMSLELKQPFKVFSDSRIAIGWALKGKTKNKSLVNQAALAAEANSLLSKSQSILQWIPREYNKAGHYLEEKYQI